MGLDNPIHLAILLLIMLLVFGAKRLPEMGRSLGDGLRGFKDAVSSESAPQALTHLPDTNVAPITTARDAEPVPASAVRSESADA